MLCAAAYSPSGLSKKAEGVLGHELAWRLLFYGMEREYGRSRSSLQIAHGPHGKPFFSNCSVKFSVSHCTGLACCVFSEKEIGVDAERVRPYDLKRARRICTPAELTFLEAAPEKGTALMTLWTLKESMMKATGKGFRLGFRNAEFLWEQGRLRPAQKELQSVNFQPFSDLLISVCGFGSLPKKVELLEAEPLFQEF